MTFSDTVSQQREKQEKTLRRFITYSLVGSFALHGVGLCLKVNDFWKPEQAKQEEIIIVATDTPEEELTEPTPEPENLPETTAEPEVATAAGTEEAGATTVLAAAPASFSPPIEAALPDPIVPEEPIPEPPPEPTPVPVVEDLPSSTPEEPTPEQPPEEPVAEDTPSEPTPEPQEKVTEATPSPVAEQPKQEVAKTPPPTPRNLNNLLQNLRRAREQASQTAANQTNSNPAATTSSRSTGTSTANPAAQGMTTAAGPSRPGARLGPGPGDGNTPGSQTGGSETPPAEKPPKRGNQSREITCRRCKPGTFVRPKEAAGAEGEPELEVTFGEGGQPEVTLSKSSGNSVLDEAALQQAREKLEKENAWKGAKAGDSVRLVVEFADQDSARDRRREERRSVTVSEPAPDPVASEIPEVPSTSAADQPANSEPTPTDTPSAIPEPTPSAAPPEPTDSPEAPSAPVEPAPEAESEPIPEPEPIP